MTHKIKARLEWVKLYETTKNAGFVCRRCGISRPTLRKWWRRFQKTGETGLNELSRRPHHSPNRKVLDKEIGWISELRKRRLGSRRIQSELLRNYAFSVSRATLCKVLQQLNVAPLKKSRILRKHRHRYERPIPGERVQIDTCKIAPGLYQYTAVDDCTRIRCLALFDRRTAANSLLFLEQMIEEMPFPIQRIQSDRGLEFFAHKFQERLKEYAIKFRPIKPRSPHLNGKVERSQRTDLEEFYPTVDLQNSELHQQLRDWQDYYNEFRPHGSLNSKTLWEKWNELSMKTPYRDEVEAAFDSSKERLRLQNYRDDLYWQNLKRSL
jgi:transposase InsO family protein